MTGHIHLNGGGWVSDTACVAESVYIGPNAKVLDKAKISGDVKILNQANVYGCANILGCFGGTIICDQSNVYGEAQIYGNAKISGNARIYGMARIFDHSKNNIYRKIKKNNKITYEKEMEVGILNFDSYVEPVIDKSLADKVSKLIVGQIHQPVFKYFVCSLIVKEAGCHGKLLENQCGTIYAALELLGFTGALELLYNSIKDEEFVNWLSTVNS